MNRARGNLLEPIAPRDSDVAEIEIGPDDTIDTLLRSIRMAGAPAVRIHAPGPSRALGSPGRVRMLAYFLREEGYQAVLATRDVQLAATARADGITVIGPAGTAGNAGATTVRSGQEPVFERISSAVPQPERASLRLPVAGTGAGLPLGRVGMLILLALAAYLAFNYFVAPSTTVTVTPEADFIPIELTVRIDPDAGELDFETATIPGQIVDAVVEDTLSKPTTGRRREAEAFATGEVTLRNRTRDAQLVPRGTRVRTAGGVRFATDVEVLVPPTLNVAGRPVPGEAVVRVTAERPGIAGNVPGLAVVAVEGRMAPALEVFNVRPLGGAREREVALVAQRDLDELRAVHLERLQSAAVERLRRDRPADEVLVVWSPASGNPEITREAFSAALDERAAVLSLDMALRARGTSFAYADLERLVAHRIATAPAGRDVTVDRIRVDATDVISEQFGVLDVRVKAVGEVVAAVDPEVVRQAVTGQPVGAGSAALRALPGVADATVVHEPADTGNFPRLGFRIDIEVEAPRAAAPA